MPNENAVLLSAVRDSEMEVIGHTSVNDKATVRTAIAVLRGFRKQAGLLYFEAVPRRGGDRPPDILLCSPEIGVLTIEVKGFPIEKISRIANGTLFVSYHGRERERNVIQQARDAMFEAKTAIGREFEPGDDPFIDWLIALPKIRESEWNERGYDQAISRENVILADDLESPAQLRSWLVDRATRRSEDRRPGRTLIMEDGILRVRRAFGDTAVIQDDRERRRTSTELSLGSIIDELATSEKNLSVEQQELSRLSVDGRPRIIRGVAGSGKTVVLANMVARTIREISRNRDESLFSEGHPLPRIGVICFNRSLVPFLKNKITAAYQSFTGTELDYDHLHIHNINGFIYSLTQQSGGPLEYIRTREMPSAEERAKNYLAQIDAVDSDWIDSLFFDAIFVDEAQDLHEDEFRLLMGLIRPESTTEDRSLIIFFDDAQNVYGLTRPVWKDLGIQAQGRTHMMKECFRNTRQVVEFSFNVLLGAQAEEDEPVQTRTFADVNDLVKRGLVEEQSDRFRVSFTDRDDGDPPFVKLFDSPEEEYDWLIEQIGKLISREEVRPEDILVLSEKHGALSEFSRRLLARQDIDIAGIVSPHKEEEKDRYIMRKGHVTVTTTKSAKGYDAYVVFVMRADEFSRENTGRASFYVGCTRARLCLYVTGQRGVGLGDESLRVRRLFWPQ